MDEAGSSKENCEQNVNQFGNVIRSIDVAKLVAVLGQTLRKKRKFKELTLFNSKYEVKGFQYVILKKERPKVAFLSGQDRKLFYEKRDTSRLACDEHFSQKSQKTIGYHEGKVNIAYPHTKPKIFSKAGYGSLASRGPRLNLQIIPCSPGPQAYHIKTYSKVKSKSLAPFDSKTVRESKLVKINNNPGVGSYDITYIEKSHNIRVEHSFGGRVKLKQMVTVECRPTSENLCKDCGHVIHGDYWRKNEDTILCDSCYRIQYYKKSYIRRQFEGFQKTRDCSFMHLHDGTTATYPLMTKKEFWTQCVNENYFSTYIDTRNIKKVEPATNKRKSRTEYTKADSSRAEQLSYSFPFLKHLDDKPVTDSLKKRFLSKQELAAFYEPVSLVPDMEQLWHEWQFERYRPVRVPSTSNEEKQSTDQISITDEQSEPKIKLKQPDRSDKYAEETRIPFNEPRKLTDSLIDMIQVMGNTCQESKLEIDTKPENTPIIQSKVDDVPREDAKDDDDDDDVVDDDKDNTEDEEEKELILTQDPNIPPLPNIFQVSDAVCMDPDIASLMSENPSIIPDNCGISMRPALHLNLDRLSTRTVKVLGRSS